MSWCGGGEMRPTPGVEWRTLAIHGYTLAPGSWPPSPGLAPWAILIWSSLRLRQVVAGHAEAAGRDLLDRAVLRVALFVGPGVALGVFAAFAGVGLAADAVHGDGERFVRFLEIEP